MIGLVISSGGCAGHTTPRTVTIDRGSARISRPVRAVWCPANRPGGFDVRSLLGLGEKQAAAEAARHGCVSRVVEVNGHHLIITADLRLDRVDLTLEDSAVTAVGVG